MAVKQCAEYVHKCDISDVSTLPHEHETLKDEPIFPRSVTVAVPEQFDCTEVALHV